MMIDYILYLNASITMDALKFKCCKRSVTAEKIIVRLPITDNIKQPYGIVHGGINAFLAETAASLGAKASLTDPNQVPVGVDIHTHHLNAATEAPCLPLQPYQIRPPYPNLDSHNFN